VARLSWRAAITVGRPATAVHLFQPGIELGNSIGEPRTALCGRRRLEALRRYSFKAGTSRTVLKLTPRRGCRRLAEGGVQPILNRHPGAQGRVSGCLIQLRAQAPFVPGSA